jgi:hypothetical protein
MTLKMRLLRLMSGSDHCASSSPPISSTVCSSFLIVPLGFPCFLSRSTAVTSDMSLAHRNPQSGLNGFVAVVSRVTSSNTSNWAVTRRPELPDTSNGNNRIIEWKQQNHRMALPDTTVTAPRSSPASAAATRRDVRRVTSSSLALPLAPGARVGERASRRMCVGGAPLV